MTKAAYMRKAGKKKNQIQILPKERVKEYMNMKSLE
jgi:hypothetical protein